MLSPCMFRGFMLVCLGMWTPMYDQLERQQRVCIAASCSESRVSEPGPCIFRLSLCLLAMHCVVPMQNHCIFPF